MKKTWLALIASFLLAAVPGAGLFLALQSILPEPYRTGTGHLLPPAAGFAIWSWASLLVFNRLRHGFFLPIHLSISAHIIVLCSASVLFTLLYALWLVCGRHQLEYVATGLIIMSGMSLPLGLLHIKESREQARKRDVSSAK